MALEVNSFSELMISDMRENTVFYVSSLSVLETDTFEVGVHVPVTSLRNAICNHAERTFVSDIQSDIHSPSVRMKKSLQPASQLV
jgi:hypothetical protein